MVPREVLKSLRGKMSSSKENFCVEDGACGSVISISHEDNGGGRVQSKPKNLHVKEDQVIQMILLQVLQ